MHKRAKVFIPLQLKDWLAEAKVAAIYQEKNVLLSTRRISFYLNIFLGFVIPTLRPFAIKWVEY